MKLDVLTESECQLVRLWRNECLETLRTSRSLTEVEQRVFFSETVCNRNSPHQYWALHGENGDPVWFIGMGGLTNISWENRIAEISLILNPDVRGKGLGEKAVNLILADGFDGMGLKTIFGECYLCNTTGVEFWEKIAGKYYTGPYCSTGTCTLKNRKFWKGKFWDSMYFSIDAEDYRKVRDAGTANQTADGH